MVDTEHDFVVTARQREWVILHRALDVLPGQTSGPDRRERFGRARLADADVDPTDVGWHMGIIESQPLGRSLKPYQRRGLRARPAIAAPVNVLCGEPPIQQLPLAAGVCHIEAVAGTFGTWPQQRRDARREAISPGRID